MAVRQGRTAGAGKVSYARRRDDVRPFLERPGEAELIETGNSLAALKGV